MTRPRASRHRITRSRQLVIDLLYFSQSVPLVAVERPMFLRELATARSDYPDRPSWTALFAKAFSLVAADCAVLRQVYFRLAPVRIRRKRSEHRLRAAHWRRRERYSRANSESG